MEREAVRAGEQVDRSKLVTRPRSRVWDAMVSRLPKGVIGDIGIRVRGPLLPTRRAGNFVNGEMRLRCWS